MRDRRDPWKWPVSIGLALSLTLAAAFWLPRSWLGFLLSSGDEASLGDRSSARQWIVLLPPPEIEVLDSVLETPPPQPAPAPRLHQDPRWWTNAWIVSAEPNPALFAPATPTAADSLRLLLSELGLGADFMTRARPDSVLAARLFKLRLEDSFRYDELKPYLLQLGRTKAYADILSREADMFDEPLRQKIQVPD